VKRFVSLKNQFEEARMTTPTNEQLRRLDLALTELEECPRSDECIVLHEHVYAAKVALLGAMHSEYQMNLDLARQALPNLKDKSIKESVEGILVPLLRDSKS
jgi:hypothetical protein